MIRKRACYASIPWVVGTLAAAVPVWGAGIDDFQLTRAIPADAMLVVHTRDHAGKEFINKQFERVWAAVERQGFDKDFKRLLKGLMQQGGTEVEGFDEQWQKIADLAAAVQWSTLMQREFAFAMKLSFPTVPDFVVLCMPPRERVEKDFEGLAALLKALVELAGAGQLTLTSEGSGTDVVHRLSLGVMPASLTLARHKDVLILGFGSSMVEQTLALLRGESDPQQAALRSSERFRRAFAKLPAPTDELFFADLAKIMGESRKFAGLVREMAAASEATTQTEDAGAAAGVAFLVPAVEAFDMWEYVASVASTDGLKKTSADIVLLRSDAEKCLLYRAFYGNEPLRSPLKYVPKEATAVAVGSGMNFLALYKAVLDFVGQHMPQGKDVLAKWEEVQTQIGFNVEEDVLSWLVGSYASFTAPGRSPYAPEWVYILTLRDEQKAKATLERLYEKLNAMLAEQNGGVEDAQLEGIEGFKRIILPPLFAMVPGLGRPVLGVKDGCLFLGNSPEVVLTALKVGAGEHENFAKNERYLKEGLPIDANVTGFEFQDLSRLGEELGQAFAMVGVAQMMMPPEVTKQPAVLTLLSVLNKVGRVVRTLDFYSSSCTVTTFDGKVLSTKSVTNYKEPPKPAVEEPTPTPAPEDKPATRDEAGA